MTSNTDGHIHDGDVRVAVQQPVWPLAKVNCAVRHFGLDPVIVRPQLDGISIPHTTRKKPILGLMLHCGMLPYGPADMAKPRKPTSQFDGWSFNGLSLEPAHPGQRQHPCSHVSLRQKNRNGLLA